MKSRVPKSTEQNAMIIAVTFNSDDTIAYHVQLNNGNIVKVYGDKYVHDIDLIDPSAPPSLSLITSHTLTHVERDVSDQDEESTIPMRAVPMESAKLGVEGVTSSRATFSEEACQSITCLRNGKKLALFNPFLNACYCQILVPPKDSFSNAVKRSQSDSTEGPARHDVEIPAMVASFPFPTPSTETCSHMIACHGESKPYFHAATKQCLCVVFRPGVKEPVITSDTNFFPRAEQGASQEEDSLGGADSPTSYRDCWKHGKMHCGRSGETGRWNASGQKCVCGIGDAIYA